MLEAKIKKQMHANRAKLKQRQKKDDAAMTKMWDNTRKSLSAIIGEIQKIQDKAK